MQSTTHPLLDQVRERDGLEPSPAWRTGHWVGSGCDVSKNRTTTANPRSSNYGVANGSPLGASDLPGYSIFQESVPLWALVTGKEHFTYSGYHSKRRCQGPSGISLGPWSEGHVVGIMFRSHGPGLSAGESWGYEGQPEPPLHCYGQCKLRGHALRHRKSARSLIQSHPSRDPRRKLPRAGLNADRYATAGRSARQQGHPMLRHAPNEVAMELVLAAKTSRTGSLRRLSILKQARR